MHAQRVKDAPRALLRSIPGLDLREMRTPDRCCGSAGLYSILQGALSGAILRDKMADVAQTGADQVCSANPGCLLQLDAGLRLYVESDAAPMRSAHVIDLLDESYRIAEGDDYARPDR